MGVKITSDVTVTFNKREIALIKESGSISVIPLLEEATGMAKIKTPFKRGTNKRSINWTFADSTGRKTDGKAEDGQSVPRNLSVKKDQGAFFTQTSYGGYLETGTSKMPARPYMLPSLQWVRGNLKNILEGKVETVAKRRGLKTTP